MKSFIRQRVVKSQTVEVLNPRLVECNNEEFRFLGNHLSVICEVTEETAISCGEDENIKKNIEVEAEEIKTDELITEAETKAQAILAQAQAEANQIKANAQIESENLKKKVSEEAAAKGQAEGYEKGFKQGRAAGRAQLEKEVEEKLQEAKAVLKLAQQAAKEEWSKVDGDLIHLSIKIAERVVRASLAVTPALLLNQIKTLILFPQSRDGWILHVSPDDFVRLMTPENQAQLQVNCISDDTLHPGDSFLECTEGIFDARLEEQLSHLEYLLKEELKHEGLESVSS